jgi:hypothetical protein
MTNLSTIKTEIKNINIKLSLLEEENKIDIPIFKWTLISKMPIKNNNILALIPDITGTEYEAFFKFSQYLDIYCDIDIISDIYKKLENTIKNISDWENFCNNDNNYLANIQRPDIYKHILSWLTQAFINGQHPIFTMIKTSLKKY